MAAPPTFIEMPEPPSNPDTPSEMPGTPNSTTTSLSALSTTAIKDGHRGSAPPGHQHHLSTNTLEAERADRISRLAGLERVTTVRPSTQTSSGGVAQGQIPGYFDANGNPVYTTKMSTVGSASATGSIGGGRTTTWASGSARGQTEVDDDEMSMDTNYRDIDERDRYSTMDQSENDDGLSDEGAASLVGFGEGAGSTVSGPTYTRSKSTLANTVSPSTPISASAAQERKDAIMTNGLADDTSSGFVDTTLRSPVPPTSDSKEGREAAERIVRDRLDDGEVGRPAMGAPDSDKGLGKFYFEGKK